MKSSALCGTAPVKKKRGFRFCSRHMQVYKLEGFSREFGSYNHNKLKYSRNMCYSNFFVVRLYLFLLSYLYDFLIYCELKFGYKFKYYNLYFIIVD